MDQKLDKSQIITLSIPKSMDDFIRTNELKPSKILQGAIAELMSQTVEVTKLKQQIDSYKQLYAKAFNEFSGFLQHKNIDWNEYQDWRKKNGSA